LLKLNLLSIQRWKIQAFDNNLGVRTPRKDSASHYGKKQIIAHIPTSIITVEKDLLHLANVEEEPRINRMGAIADIVVPF
jgi:hypothetical protein